MNRADRHERTVMMRAFFGRGAGTAAAAATAVPCGTDCTGGGWDCGPPGCW